MVPITTLLLKVEVSFTVRPYNVVVPEPFTVKSLLLITTLLLRVVEPSTSNV